MTTSSRKPEKATITNVETNDKFEVLFNPTQQDQYADRLVVFYSGDGSPLLVDIVGSAFVRID